MTNLDLIATSTFGLEAVVSRELRSLGYDCKTIQDGRVLFRGDETAIARANLWLRASDRVLLRMGAFPVKDFGELFDRTRDLPWEDWIPRDAAFPVTGRSVRSQLSSVPACQRIVKKAIVERLKSLRGVDWLEESGPVCGVEIALLRNQATLTIDTSGPGLHKRGYRTGSGAAPLKETLAAGLVLLSFWRPDRPLIDPFCGTGTIPIEAALIGRNAAPGLQRVFVAEAWPGIPPGVWERARQEAKDLRASGTALHIRGSDVAPQLIDMAHLHAQHAGVGEDIRFECRSFQELRSDQEYGCIICNPPYGQRVGEVEEVRRLYDSMPRTLRGFPTWSHYILTAYEGLEKTLGREADRRRKLRNGPIECTYYQFHGPKPGGVATGPGFGGISKRARQQLEAFRGRIGKRYRHLRKWAAKAHICCYRLYDRDIPETPLIVEVYADQLLIREADHPRDSAPSEREELREKIVQIVMEVTGCPETHVYFADHDPVVPATAEFEIQDGDHRFMIRFGELTGTGLPLDERALRMRIGDEARGKAFLNLFAGAGSLSVCAAAGGAIRTTSVGGQAEWIARNLKTNGIEGEQHAVLSDDVAAFLARGPGEAAYDLAVLAPPASEGDPAGLLNATLRLVKRGGVIYFMWRGRGPALKDLDVQGAKAEEITRRTIPQEFRDREAHRCWRVSRA